MMPSNAYITGDMSLPCLGFLGSSMALLRVIPGDAPAEGDAPPDRVGGASLFQWKNQVLNLSDAPDAPLFLPLIACAPPRSRARTRVGQFRIYPSSPASEGLSHCTEEENRDEPPPFITGSSPASLLEGAL